eukprot:234240_1
MMQQRRISCEDIDCRFYHRNGCRYGTNCRYKHKLNPHSSIGTLNHRLETLERKVLQKLDTSPRNQLNAKPVYDGDHQISLHDVIMVLNDILKRVESIERIEQSMERIQRTLEKSNHVTSEIDISIASLLLKEQRRSDQFTEIGDKIKFLEESIKRNGKEIKDIVCKDTSIRKDQIHTKENNELIDELKLEMNLISKRIISNQNAMAEVVSTLSKDMVSERARKPHKLSVNMCDPISICELVSEPMIKAKIGQEIQLLHCNPPWNPFKTAKVHCQYEKKK